MDVDFNDLNKMIFTKISIVSENAKDFELSEQLNALKTIEKLIVMLKASIEIPNQDGLVENDVMDYF